MALFISVFIYSIIKPITVAFESLQRLCSPISPWVIAATCQPLHLPPTQIAQHALEWRLFQFSTTPPPCPAPITFRIKRQCFTMVLRSLLFQLGSCHASPAPAMLPHLQCHAKLVLLSELFEVIAPCMVNSSSRSSLLATSSYSYLSTDVTYSGKLLLMIPT